MRYYPLALLICSLPGILAGPQVAGSSPYCLLLNELVTSLAEQSSATAFCSSYLGIPVSTLTSTSTAIGTQTQYSVSTYTVTLTDAVPVFTTTPITITTPETVFQTVTKAIPASCTGVPSIVARARSVQARASVCVPSAYNHLGSGAPLSSACRCLSIAPSSTIITTTVTEYPSTTTVIFYPPTTTRTSLPYTQAFGSVTTFVSGTVTSTLTATGPFKIQATATNVPNWYMSIDPYNGGVLAFSPDVTRAEAVGLSLLSNGSLLVEGTKRQVLVDCGYQTEGYLGFNQDYCLEFGIITQETPAACTLTDCTIYCSGALNYNPGPNYLLNFSSAGLSSLGWGIGIASYPGTPIYGFVPYILPL